MTKSFSFGNVNVALTAGAGGNTGPPASSDPFHVVVLGDFSGRANRGISEGGVGLASRKAHEIDRDNFDDVLAKLGVELRLPAGQSGELTVSFGELDDFHPDRIFDRVELFGKLRQTRRRLKNNATFAQAAEEVRSWAEAADQATKQPRPPEPAPSADEPPPETGADVIAEMLAETPSAKTGSASPTSDVDWSAVIGEIVQPYLVPGADPSQPDLIAQVDRATSRQMAALLHHRQFQELESAWRSLFFLVRRLETDAKLKIHLYDISRQEIEGDLTSAEDLDSTGLYKLLVEQTVDTPGARRWALLTGVYSFGKNVADAELLGRLAKVAKQAGAPFLGAASSDVVACGSFAESPDPDDWDLAAEPDSEAAWTALRNLPESSSVGLALPRFLLRVPYGKKTDPAESFDFEEIPDGAAHEEYLWGSSACFVATLVGQAFTAEGWGLRPGVISELDRLPIHVYDDDGDSTVKAPAEAFLTMRAGELMVERGLIPLLSVKNSDSVRVLSIVSIDQRGSRLAGRW